MILNQEQLSLTWLYFLTPQGGCESELMFLKHFAWKIMAAAYIFACYSSSFWLTMHFCAPYFLCLSLCCVGLHQDVFYSKNSLWKQETSPYPELATPKDQVPAAHFMPYMLLKCLAAVHGLMFFSEELRESVLLLDDQMNLIYKQIYTSLFLRDHHIKMHSWISRLLMCSKRGFVTNVMQVFWTTGTHNIQHFAKLLSVLGWVLKC